MKYKFTEEQLQLAVNKSLSIAQVCRELGIRPVGGNYKTLHAKLKLFNINTAHFTGAAWNQGKRFKSFSKTHLNEDVFKVDSIVVNNRVVKKRLLDQGILTYRCAVCNISEWNGKPITLELNHINGVNTDNTILNLELLCPNCHSQTDNFRGKNKTSALAEKRQKEYEQ